jgi:hypothetical protein
VIDIHAKAQPRHWPPLSCLRRKAQALLSMSGMFEGQQPLGFGDRCMGAFAIRI